MNYQDYFNSLNDFERKNAPKELFYEGNFNLISQGKRISVVGSRNASIEGLRRAEIITRLLVKKGFIVVSGLAKGIDTVAHQTAIKMGGNTITVVGTPLDQVYPKENIDLFNNIKLNHLALSQFDTGYPTLPKNFPIRNRTMALISDATIIIEANEKSGTIHQGWEAIRLGRQLYILDNIKRKNFSWVNEFESYGAQILTRDNIDLVLDETPNVTEKLLDEVPF